MGKVVSKVDLHAGLSKNLKSMGFHKVSIFCVFVKKVTLGGNHISYNSTNKIPGENPSNGTGASLRVSMLDFFLMRDLLRESSYGFDSSKTQSVDQKSGGW